MQNISFEHAVEKIVAKDPRYSEGGYQFLRDALDFTISKLESPVVEKKDPSRQQTKGHVDGAQLLEGFRRLALKRFGPMAITVLEEWGISCTADVGEMVFNLIAAEVFGKTDEDSKDDFADVYEFHDAFEVPFLPKQRQG